MSVLLISNGAPGYHNFFNALAKNYASDGRNVVVAVDCAYSRDLNRLDDLGFLIHDFSESFGRWEYRQDRLQPYLQHNLNAALLSDYERAEIYGFSGGRTGDYYQRLACALIEFFEDLFDAHEVTEVIYEGVSNSFAHFAYFVALNRGATYKGLISSRLPGRYAITSDACDESALLMSAFIAIRAGDIALEARDKVWCENYLRNLDAVTPDYMKFNHLEKVAVLSRYLNLNKFKKALVICRHLGDNHSAAFQIGNPLRYSWAMVRRNLARRFRLSKVFRKYAKPDLGELYYLYPLHFHPEASTSILAGAYLNEYEVVRNIAFNLPQGVKLYVKDHVSSFGFQDAGFYERIRSLPNVVLVGPFEPTKTLIRRSCGVVTLTSTVGYEALLLGKRVFLFGRVFYEHHKHVVKVSDPARLFEMFSEHRQPVTLDHEYNLDFVSAYFHVTRPGTLNLMSGPDEASALANAVYEDVRDYKFH